MKIENKNREAANTSRWRNWKTIAIALYITFLFLSTIPYIADRSIEPDMQESYTYHLTYPVDGRQTHYYVERVDTSNVGRVDLTYTTSSNSLEVKTQNIKVLHIYCRSMYEDECREVYGIDPLDNSNYYKWYFIEKNHFNVNIDSDHVIEELKFIDTPLAYKVLVNGEQWSEGLDYYYVDNFGNALSNVPSGFTNVDLYFKPSQDDKGTPPVAILKASKTYVPVNYTVLFDATESYDPDGIITRYVLDFGDESFLSSSKATHAFSKPGIYGVILTIRDDEYLVDHAYVNITVIQSTSKPEIQGVVPNQEMPEDSPPWALNLSIFKPIPTMEEVQFYWFLSGENTSIYKVSGENDTESNLIFTPISNAYGSDLVTLWLRSSENQTDSQPLWINITPVNDPPTIQPLPDLIVHYDDPYTFNYLPYINDIETPNDQLTLDIFDGLEKKYITIDGLSATYNYPQELVGESIFVSIMVSDGEAIAQDVISIQVTSDRVPKRIKELPDIWLYEGTTKYNVFDLDDYFTDPDNDAIYFSYGFTHLDINIHLNHTVDISADSEWTGSELVTFRARDPIGALAEDTIVVTVLPVNDPPIIEGLPNFIIRYDLDYRFDLTPYVKDKDNSTQQLRIVPSDHEHIRLDVKNNMVIIMNYPEEFLGRTLTVRLTVTDGLASSFQDVKVTITEDFPPELIRPLPDVVFLEDSALQNAFDLDYYFLDIDNDLLYYTTGNKLVNITINTDNTVDLSAPQNWFGTELVYFRATDPTGALIEDIVTITVLPVNDGPSLLPIPKQYGNESQRWVLDLTPYIYDVDNNISEMEISVDNDFVVISGSTLIFIGTREMPKEVLVTVSDGELYAEQVVEVHLKLAHKPKVKTLFDLFLSILPFIIIIILIIIIVAGAIYAKKSYFKAEEVFLIHHGGTLITHLSRNIQANVDDVIFSGMFTAVQDFIKDTFTTDEEREKEIEEHRESKWALDELKLGDNNILIERSDYTYLAVIFSGEGSKRLRRIVNKALNKIETRYEDILPTWDGNINELKGTNEILSDLIKVEEPEKPVLPITKLKTTIVSPIIHEPPQQPSLLAQLIDEFDTPSVPAPPPKLSAPINAILPIKKPQQIPTSKDLTKVIRERTGAKYSGLTAWPVNKRQFRKGRSLILTNKWFRYPMALQIRQQKPIPKTIVIERGKIKVDDKLNKLDDYPSVKGKPIIKPITVEFPKNRKPYKSDPLTSFFQQMDEINEKD